MGFFTKKDQKKKAIEIEKQKEAIGIMNTLYESLNTHQEYYKAKAEKMEPEKLKLENEKLEKEKQLREQQEKERLLKEQQEKDRILKEQKEIEHQQAVIKEQKEQQKYIKENMVGYTVEELFKLNIRNQEIIIQNQEKQISLLEKSLNEQEQTQTNTNMLWDKLCDNRDDIIYKLDDVKDAIRDRY